jgi:hypothetical protein
MLHVPVWDSRRSFLPPPLFSDHDPKDNYLEKNRRGNSVPRPINLAGQPQGQENQK